MLDLKSKLILKILINECPNGTYKIIDAKDIISLLPNKYKIDLKTFEKILIFLERQECISIKYDDENTYCLCVLPLSFELLEENIDKQKREDKQSPHLWTFIIIILFCSFFASFLGTILAHYLNLF